MVTNKDSGHSYLYFVVLLAMPWNPHSQAILGISGVHITCVCRQISLCSYPLASTDFKSVKGVGTLKLLHCSPGVHGLNHNTNELSHSWNARYVAMARGENKGYRIGFSLPLDLQHIGCSKSLTKFLKKTTLHFSS